MRNFWLVVGVGVLLGTFWACDPDMEFESGSGVELAFSVDTLRFDTVFTEVGSATRSFKVYNPGSQAVRIDRIYIDGKSNTRFRMNVDGFVGEDLSDVTIFGRDSIYVFVETTIDPTQPTNLSPFVIEDRIIFETGDVDREVKLEAWGQNAIYMPSRFNRGIPVLLTCDDGTVRWDSKLPYVIYGEIIIDSCLLEIAAGTRIYVHGGIARNDVFDVFNDGFLYTFAKGRIHILGTQEEPVVLQTDRLEEDFADLPGQWTGIVFGRGSRDNRIEHAVIKHSIFGVYVDSAAELTLRSTQIHTTASSAVFGYHSTITAENCLFYDNAANAVQLIHGGDYRFDYCTAASYGVDASALALTNFQCYDNNCELFNVYRLNATFRNCIFAGSRADEIILRDASERQEPQLFQLDMQHCVVRVRDLLTRDNAFYGDFFDTYCRNCIDVESTDPLFLNREENDYHLDTMSVALDKALPIPEIMQDLEGKARGDMPDVGCYELEL